MDFWLLFCNHWTEFDETWHKAITRSAWRLLSTYIICVFWADRKSNMTALASDGLRYFQLLLCNNWTEFKKLDRKWLGRWSQRPLPSLCLSSVPIWKPRPTLASDWLRLYLCNRRTKFDDTWQKASSQHSLSIKCDFWGRSENPDDCSGLCLARQSFATFSLQPLNRIHWCNETWQD